MRTASKVMLLAALSAVFAFCADPLVGTWKLNLDKSKFVPGPAPRSQTRTYKDANGHITVTVKTVDAKGKSTTTEFPAIYDGNAHPVKGPGPIDALVLDRVNNFQAHATLKHAGKVIATADRTVSEDGALLTISYKELEGESPVQHVSVYEKVQDKQASVK